MEKNIERLWVSLIDSNAFRNFSKRGAGSVIFRSRAYQKLRLQFNFATSYIQCLRYPALFQDANTFCLFIGHNKSGTSMLGSLLDAHPDVVLSDEADALEYVSAGFSKEQIFHILLKTSRREFLKGRVTARRLKPYAYLVPGQWQGRYETLRVIGDSTSGSTTQRFARDADLLGQLQGLMSGVDVKFIQVIRNPFDPISVMMVRGKRSFENSINHYFTSCETLVQLRERIPGSRLLAVRYEDFINHPAAHLERVCHFLGIQASDDYVKACTHILHQKPDISRHMVNWDRPWIKLVERKIEGYDFLEGYSW